MQEIFKIPTFRSRPATILSLYYEYKLKRKLQLVIKKAFKYKISNKLKYSKQEIFHRHLTDICLNLYALF